MYPRLQALSTPDKPALIMADSGTVVTYRELDDRSTQLARAWRRLGLGPGDHVALLSENHPNYLEVYWAATRSGLHLTPINRHLSVDEVAFIVEDCGAKSMIVSSILADTGARVRELVPACGHGLMFDVAAAGFESYEDALESESVEPLSDQPRGSLMCYSSGTTGKPKGVFQGLSGLQVDDESDRGRIGLFEDVFGMDDATRYLSPAPLYHAAPLGYSSAVQALGGTVIVMERFEPVHALQLLTDHQITHSQWVPTMFVRLLKLAASERHGFDLSNHRFAIHAAAPCPVEVKRRMIDWWGPILWEYYSGTEGNGITMIDSERWLEHPGSVGIPVWGTLHICGDDGAELPIGEPGSIYFEREGPQFRYHGDPTKTGSTRHPAHPTWTTIGDIGYLDADGYLYLTDRKSFMIIRGGVNIYPQEVEDCLIMHDSVADVAVFGVPDPDLGESVHAVVQPAVGESPDDALAVELTRYALERIARYKVPATLEFTTELPRTATGKLLKKQLQARYR